MRYNDIDNIIKAPFNFSHTKQDKKLLYDITKKMYKEHRNSKAIRKIYFTLRTQIAEYNERQTQEKRKIAL